MSPAHMRQDASPSQPCLSYPSLRMAVLLYGSLPIIIFLAFWLKAIVSVPVFLSMVLALVCCLRRGGDKNYYHAPYDVCLGREHRHDIPIGWWWLGCIVLIALAWCVLGGQGGFWYQTEDWRTRNALYRDLVTHSWPVRYESDGGWLCYYIGYWLPPALAAKAFAAMGASMSLTWLAARVALLLWTTCGIVLLMLLVIVTVAPRGHAGMMLCLLVPLLFATPDIVGMLATGTVQPSWGNEHLEWWAINAQYSSLTTCLFFVFNQTVIPWLCVLCFVNERTPAHYLLLWLCCLSAGPLPSFGLAIFMLCQGLYALLRERRQGLMRAVFSPDNMLSIPAIAIMLLYFVVNQAAATDSTGEWAVHNLLPFPFYLPSDRAELVLVVAFILVEGLLMPAILRACGLRGPLLATATLTLMLCPFIRFSKFSDFCMRASIPAILVLCVLSISVFAAPPDRDIHPIRRVVTSLMLAITLCLGSITPLMEVYRGIHYIRDEGIENAQKEDIITFEGKTGWPRSNYVVSDRDAGIFFGSLVRR